MLKDLPFVDREEEMAFLNRTLQKSHPTPARLTLIYGRRRIGKTSLLQRWAMGSGLPYTYWSAEKEPAPLQRRKLLAKVWRTDVRSAPLTESWSELWERIQDRLNDERHLLILDELPYAAESDPAMLSSLQHAWDHLYQRSNLVILLCGSHVRTMETLMSHQSPLFGRMTGQWHLGPLPFSALKPLFPAWSAEERVAAYGIAGGIPAYLSWLNPALSMVENVREEILDPGGLFMAEPMVLLYDEVREPAPHLAVLKAIGRGYHTLDEISNDALIGKNNLSVYLARLQELRLVERRLPVTVAPNAQRISRRGRYHLSDAFFRFYFRFIAPEHDRLNLASARETIAAHIRDQLRGFLSLSAFEPLAQQWVAHQGQAGRLPFHPEYVGAHWSRKVQVDVVGIHWGKKRILLGECKWGLDEINHQVVRELIEEKTPKVLAELPDGGQNWGVTHAIFARRGFTPAARKTMRKQGGLLVDLKQLDMDMSTE